MTLKSIANHSFIFVLKILIILMIFSADAQSAQIRTTGLQKEQIDAYNACKRELESLEKQKEATLLRQNGLDEKFKIAKSRLRHLYFCLYNKNVDSYNVAVNDSVISANLKSFAASHPSIFIAAGNAFSDYQDPNNQLAQELEVLVTNLAKRDVLMVYDADSMASKLIERIVPETQRLGISGQEMIANSGRGLIHTIKNPYLRLTTILSFKHIYVAPDSILALGLLVEKNRSVNEHIYYSTSNQLKFGLVEWSRKLEYPHSSRYQWPEHHSSRKGVIESESPRVHRTVITRLRQKLKNPPTPSVFDQPMQAPAPGELKTSEVESKVAPQAYRIVQPSMDMRVFHGTFKNLGISYPVADMKIGNPLELAMSMPFTVRKKNAEFNLFETYLNEAIENFKQKDIDTPFAFAESYSEKEKSIDQKLRDNCFQPIRETNLYAGAVLFGSGKGGSYFEPLVKNSITVVASRGLSVTTGGEAGFMEIANKEAKEIGIYSVGIILGKSEFSKRDYHSETIVANGYEQRIPFLLLKKALVIFAPGGTGTMTELATTLVKMASDTELVPVVFLDVNYYGGLANWFKSLNLPNQFANSIKFIESAEKMKEFLP